MSTEPINTGDHEMEAAAPVDNVQSESQDSVENKENNNVPLEALQAERAQRQNLQEELRVIKDHIALMQTQQYTQKPQESKEEMDGLADDDVLTVGEAKKYLSKMNQQYQMSIEELKMVQKHPDYQDVVSKYLPEVIKQNPSLRKTLQDSQDYELAYYLARNSESFKKANKKMKKSADAERIVQNAQEAGSLSSMGSTTSMNQARKYKEMSDEEFSKIVNRNMGHF
jgi:hypothetical protein